MEGGRDVAISNHSDLPASPGGGPKVKRPDAIQIVIIGCGYAGGMVARKLDEQLPQLRASGVNVDLVVIDRHDMVWLKISAIRASVDPTWASRTQVPIREIVKNGKFVLGNVSQIDNDNKVITVTQTDQPGEPSLIPYDILLCASGALNGSPADLPENITSKEQATEYLSSIQTAIKESSKIAIIGGGMTSVEFAGEIRSVYPDKEITIVCAADEMLSSSIAKPSRTFMKLLAKRLAANNIKVILGHRSVSPAMKDFAQGKTGKVPFLKGARQVRCEGKGSVTFDADLAIWAGSWKFNNGFYPRDWVNDVGELKIDDSFVVEGTDNSVFAFGDISALLETKQAITLLPKVPCIVANMVNVATVMSRNRDSAGSQKLRRYKMTNRPLIYLPIGPRDGVSISQMGFTYGGAKTAKWKGRDLFSAKFWQMLTGHAPA